MSRREANLYRGWPRSRPWIRPHLPLNLRTAVTGPHAAEARHPYRQNWS